MRSRCSTPTTTTPTPTARPRPCTGRRPRSSTRAVPPASGRRTTSCSTGRTSRPTARCGTPPASPYSSTGSWCRRTPPSPAGRCTAAGHITSRTRTSCRSCCRITATRSATATSGYASWAALLDRTLPHANARLPRPRSAAAARAPRAGPVAPGRPRRSQGRYPARRGAGGRLLLAPREAEPRPARVSRGGERLHGRRHAAHRGAAGAAVPRDAGPDQGDGPHGAVPQPRLLVLQPHRGGKAVPDLLSQEGQPRRARGRDPRSERAGAGQAVPRLGRLRRQSRRQSPPVSRGHHSVPRVHAVREGPGLGAADRLDPGRVERDRLGGRQPDVLLPDGRLG